MGEENKDTEIYMAFPEDNDSSKKNPPPSADKEKSEPLVRPWVRFWARSVDEVLFSYVFAFLLFYFVPSFFEGPYYLAFAVSCLFCWIFVETAFLITWGTTPGKWILNIRIQANNGQKPSVLHAFKRSVKVWFFGEGIGVPFISIFTLFCAYFELDKNKICTWDKSEQFTITHRPLSHYRIFAASMILVVSTALSIYATFF
ncbi:RDD family protein [Legionella waltersii]|uniref:RDD family protein n=1 Tax=Legionella waltersii TaxID=66969 RepID=A0A0W1ABV4_9GAMM|nr:RDD family protein [Legionella waltersii]KTD78795.1 RDD family protein [Legionella waltersii]SNV11106.1 RDD family [Legionella waltersii]